MAPPKGSKFWMKRTKHGRDRIFADASVLWEAACEYFTYATNTPLWSTEFNGKDAIECHVPKMRPFTRAGLCTFLWVSQTYFHDFKESIEKKKAENRTPSDLAFMETIAMIEQVIFQQKFDGAAAGLLNANLISRELGMLDKTATEVAATMDIAKQKITVTVRHSTVALESDTGLDDEPNTDE